MEKNEYDQPVGSPVENWGGAERPERVTLTGTYCRLEPVNAVDHAVDLFEAYATATDGRDWTYLPYGPFDSVGDYRSHAEALEASSDPLHFAVISLETGKAVGTLSLMRQDPAAGSIEVGHVVFSPLLARTRESTEAQYLAMQYAFDELGYRRYEWKCDDLNAPSRRTAERLGFTYEGTFRQATVVKGRNRDTAWFSVTDTEWPGVRDAFTAWLDASNFNGDGRQLRKLEELRS